MISIDKFCETRLSHIDPALRRKLRSCKNIGDGYIVMDGKTLLSFASNDYLCLSRDIAVLEASIHSQTCYGSGAAASRMVTGNHDAYNILEAKLSSLSGMDKTLIFNSGFSANYSIIKELLFKNDLLLVDREIHASVMEGAGGTKVVRFEHNDLASYTNMLHKHRDQYENCMVCVESVYSIDGSAAPLSEMYKIAKQFNCWFTVDHSHSIINRYSYQADIKVGTLSKIFASCGGYVCSSKSVIELLLNKSKSLIYSTALPPAVISSASTAIDIFLSIADKDKPYLLAKQFCATLGLAEPQSHIVAIPCNSSQNALDIEKKIQDLGYFAMAMRPPTVKNACIRFAFNYGHTFEQVKALCCDMKKCHEFVSIACN